MIYVILGMHKSGTTLLSQMLHNSGINMGDFDDTVGYDAGNQYERKETQEINKKILKCGNEFSLNVVKSLASDDLNNVSELKIRAKCLIDDLNRKYENWGFKDPRTCLTYQFWRDIMPEHKILFVYRPPEEVTVHYLRGVSALKILTRIRRCWQSISAWYIYNYQCLEYLRENGKIEFITVDYYDLMRSDKILKKLEKFTGLSISDSRNKTLYRSRKGPNRIFLFLAWIQAKIFRRPVKRLYQSLKALNNHTA